MADGYKMSSLNTPPVKCLDTKSTRIPSWLRPREVVQVDNIVVVVVQSDSDSNDDDSQVLAKSAQVKDFFQKASVTASTEHLNSEVDKV